MAFETTIEKEVAVEGVGLHTGNKSKVVFKPAVAGSGIKFVRVDLPNRPVISADYNHVATGKAVRGSTIALGEAKVHTIEHIMASAFALGIDNLEVEIDNNEPPILDGSANGFARAMLEAGVKELGAQRMYLTLDEPVVYTSGKTTISAYPSDNFEIDCTIGFDHPYISHQQLSIEVNKESFLNEIAPGRTFCFDYEIEALQAAGLAKGGSLDNALVIAAAGIHNKDPLRFQDEFVRHKILDLIGDVYLAGRPIKVKIVADKPGHNHNINFVKEFIKAAKPQY
ncbi:MAG: UDP-3-O-acyl-N-acetylglucosamine deacetylase [Elusimicrobia bacterium]|nr:UDP-3-O-acyl-N-acetylglucosamine deacetylase [Elusimicrobiota bacterium]